MYAGTKVNWHEVLMPDSVAAANDESLPLFLCAFSSEKGPESITDLVYSDFRSLYGNTPDFFKYGQPLVQAHMILAAGGRVLGKRIVADDATLANLVIVANVSDVSENVTKVTTETQSQTDPETGEVTTTEVEVEKQVYLDANGNETFEVTEDPLVRTYAKIKYEVKTIEGKKNYTEVAEAAAELADAEAGVYPLFVICDNGRGTSVKKVRITPDYEVSRNMSYMLYRCADIENTNTVESVRFAVYPDAINTVNGVRKAMELTLRSMKQFQAEAVGEQMEAFVQKLADITGYTTAELYKFDVLFGKTVKGGDISSIVVDETGDDITTTYGLDLKSGTNGSLGDAPFPGEKCTEEWGSAAAAYFNGEFSDEIYDLDQHKIDFCVDANYPDVVKKAISDLADFRQDFFYFRDLGLDIFTIADVQDKISLNEWTKSCFVADYISTYDIIEPYSRKQVKVTMTYGLAPLLVAHYANNFAAPVAGEFNNFVISNFVENTLNIIPRITPRVDQKQILDDLRVNFLNLTSDYLLAIQSTYTTQDHEGPLSYVNNVVVTQMVIKAIRRYCPKIRFMLMDPGTTDFDKYRQMIEDNVISQYTQYFKSITMIYTRDDDMIAKKIFNASLYCYYRDFPQGEIFDVFAVEGSPDNNPIQYI